VSDSHNPADTLLQAGILPWHLDRTWVATYCVAARNAGASCGRYGGARPGRDRAESTTSYLSTTIWRPGSADTLTRLPILWLTLQASWRTTPKKW